MKPKKNPEIAVGRNSSLYFAVGLNLVLLLTYLSFEYKSYSTTDFSSELVYVETDVETDIPIVNLNVPPPPPPPPALAPNEIKVVEDQIDVEESVIESSEIAICCAAAFNLAGIRR